MKRVFVFMITVIVVNIGMLGVDRAFGQRTVGVNVGDWGVYTVFHSGNETFPPQLPLDLEWINLTVQEISGTNITFEQIHHYADGTEVSGINSVDVDTGQGHGTGMFIAKNLNESDLIYTSPPPSGPFGLNFGGITINETIPQLYIGETAKANHLNITEKQSSPEGNRTVSLNFYWYKETGMLAEMSVSTISVGVGNMTWLEYKAVITAVIPEFPSFFIPQLFMTAMLLAVIVYRRRYPRQG